jgi:hypothetical protein
MKKEIILISLIGLYWLVEYKKYRIVKKLYDEKQKQKEVIKRFKWLVDYKNFVIDDLNSKIKQNGTKPVTEHK